MQDLIHGKETSPQSWLPAFSTTLSDPRLSEGIQAKILSLPVDSFLLQLEDQFDSAKFLSARQTMVKVIAQEFQKDFLKIYDKNHNLRTESHDPKDFEKRSLKNKALFYLSQLPEFQELPYKQFSEAKIMTDQSAALYILSNLEHSKREIALDQFYQQWKDDSIVLNKWFSLQASSNQPDTFKRVQSLWLHPKFDKKNPNRIYSLLRAFTSNLVRFHDPAYDTYAFLADRLVEIDQINPQVAARIAGGFNLWRKQSPELQGRAKKQLEKLMSSKLSANTYEIISKCLG